MAELETRELEYFVAVAEDLHFLRAADRLHVAQSALSRTVAKLEARLGVRLLDRSSREVRLTVAGERLLRDARVVLSDLERAAAGVRAPRFERPTFRLVVKAGADDELVFGMVSAWEHLAGVPAVELVFGGLTDRVEHLLDGRADVALLWEPLDDTSGLATRRLRTEPRVALLPAQHRLADRTALRLADLAGEPVANWKGLPGGDGPEISSVAELHLVVALGRAVAVLPPSTTGPLESDVVAVPVTDAPWSRTVLGWLPGHETPAILALADIATDIAGH